MSSKSFLGVAKRVEQGARDLGWLVDLASKLKEIGSIEQAESEIRDRYSKESVKLDALLGQVKVAQDSMEAAEARQAVAEERANEKLKEMQEMVNDTYAKAKASAAEMIGAAEVEVQETKKQLGIEKQSLQDSLERERLKLSRVQKEVEEATDTLKLIEDKISSAKERAMKAYQETFRTEIK